MTFVRLTEEEKAYYLENGSGSLDSLLGELGSSSVEIPDGEPTVGELSGTINGHSITVLGAEAITDSNGAPAIRFWYDFTNGSDKDASALWEVFFNAAQDGEALETATASTGDSVPEDTAAFDELAPGATCRCTETYTFDPNGGTVALRLSDLLDTGEMIYYADPQNLSGAPAK